MRTYPVRLKQFACSEEARTIQLDQRWVCRILGSLRDLDKQEFKLSWFQERRRNAGLFISISHDLAADPMSRTGHMIDQRSDGIGSSASASPREEGQVRTRAIFSQSYRFRKERAKLSYLNQNSRQVTDCLLSLFLCYLCTDIVFPVFATAT